MEKAVTVLTPNGRRQTVKVNLNATILQILEEVCRKHGLRPEQYDIKHHNKCLDTSTIIRFSGLPNNAQLELSEAVTQREDGIVTLGIQLENGHRLTDTFNPNNTLYYILNKICPEEITPGTNPVVIYMRREIYGDTLLKETTLRNLGLTNGRAMLRLIHRAPEELRTQANVSAPLPARPVQEKPYIRPFQKVETFTIKDNSSDVYHEVGTKNYSYTNIENQHTDLKEDSKMEPEVTSTKRIFTTPRVRESPKIYSKAVKEKTVAEEDFIFVGARNAMIFSQETAEAIPSEELPDDFFELTVTDAKKLLKDLKKHRIELENAPLQTAAYRELIQSTHELTQLNKYKKAVIRVHFPDQSVLQGVFKPIDTIQTVTEFVREYLDDQKLDFYLYTTPPKNILNLESKLIEVNCVPNAVLHFGTKDIVRDGIYLKVELLTKFTTSSIASLAAAKMRQETTRPPSRTLNEDEMSLSDFPPDDANERASTSTDRYGYEDYARKVVTSPEAKIPKWFKTSK